MKIVITTLDKKHKILSAALHLFVEQGIDATSTAKIAKQAGVASGLIFHHFGSKENLIDHLYLKIKVDLSSSPDLGISFDEFSEIAFKQLWYHLIEKGLKHINAVRFLHQYSYSRFSKKTEQEQVNPFFEVYRNFFQHGIDLGLIKNISLEFLAEQTFDQLLFVIMFIEDKKASKEEIEQMYQVSRDMVFI